MARWLRPWLVGCLLATSSFAGCGDQATGLQIQPSLQRSCTAEPISYGIACVSHLEARLLDAELSVLQTSCAEVDPGIFENAQNLVNATEVVPLLEDVRPREAVYVELRGYHDLVQADPCQGDTPSREDLMFWGRSELLDLTDDALTEISIPIECRDRCDCGSLDVEAACPFDFTASTRICTPSVRCRKSCEADSDCFDDSGMTCGATGRCRPIASEGMCFECDSNLDCDASLGLVCVSHTNESGTERFCARTCPSDTSLTACPGNMACELPDDEDLLLLP